MKTKTTAAILFIFLSIIPASGQSEQAIDTKGKKIESQSFETSFKNFGKVEFASYSDYQHSRRD